MATLGKALGVAAVTLYAAKAAKASTAGAIVAAAITAVLFAGISMGADANTSSAEQGGGGDAPPHNPEIVP